MDKYTSVQNKQFVNVIIHSKSEQWNLGVFWIEGSMTAGRIVKLVYNLFGAYFLSLDEHTVWATTDGASGMVKYRKLVLQETSAVLCTHKPPGGNGCPLYTCW